MSLQIKTRQFSEALREYQLATKKDMKDVVNRSLRNVGFRAAQFTPKKSPAVIEEELRHDKIALKFITKRLRARIGTAYQTAKGNMRVVKRVTRKQIALRTRQFIKGRKKRTGFLRAGWVAALVKAGLKTTGLSGNIIKDSKSSLGTGKQATIKKLTGRLGNGVWGRLNGKGAGSIRKAMQGALAQAMNFVARDMSSYAHGLMSKTAAKYSARRSG